MPWPLHIFPLFLIFHHLLLQLSPENNLKINNYCSAAFQIIGGLIVLHSINSNMSLLSKSNMIKEAYNWLKDFPIRGKEHNISVSGIASAVTGLSANIVVTPKLSSIEEKVDYLLQETKRIESKIDETKKGFKKELQSATIKSNKKHDQLQSEIREIEIKLKDTIVGSVKLEILGILTVAYGIIIPVFY